MFYSKISHGLGKAGSQQGADPGVCVWGGGGRIADFISFF